MLSHLQPSLLPLTQQQLRNLNRGENINNNWENTRLEKILAQRDIGEGMDISFVAKETEVRNKTYFNRFIFCIDR